MDPRVWFVTPFHRREALTELTMLQRRKMLERLPFEAGAVFIGEGENLELARRLGHEAIEMPNDWLGAKFNAGYQRALECGATHVMAIGSDSWLSEHALLDIEWPENEAVGFCGLSSFSPDGLERCDLYVRYAAGFGVGMLYARSMLRDEPCDPYKQRGIDTSTWSRCKGRIRFQDNPAHTFLNFHSPDVQITDWSTLMNVRSFNKKRDLERVYAPLRGNFDWDLVERVQGVYASHAVGVFLTGERPELETPRGGRNRRTTPGRGGRKTRPAVNYRAQLPAPKPNWGRPHVPKTYAESLDRFRTLI